MLWSRNSFFKQDSDILQEAQKDLVSILKIRGRTEQDIKKYIVAYNYFIANPDDYDGATVVKDLVDVRTSSGYLDADAMLHDFEYLNGANRNFIKKWKSDKQYIKNMELNGKGIRVTRFLLLTLIGVVFVPYVILFR